MTQLIHGGNGIWTQAFLALKSVLLRLSKSRGTLTIILCFFFMNNTLEGCYGLKICISPKFKCWSLIPKMMDAGGGSFGRQLGYKRDWIKESSLAPSSMWGYSKNTVLHTTGKGFLPDTESTDLDLGLPSYQNDEK